MPIPFSYCSVASLAGGRRPQSRWNSSAACTKALPSLARHAACHVSTAATVARGIRRRDAPQIALGGERDGHDAHVLHRGHPRQPRPPSPPGPAPSFQPGQSTICTWTSRPAASSRRRTRTDGARGGAHERDASLVVPGVQRHVQRREAQPHDAVDVARREVGEGDERAVQEGQPVVVVLDVEAGAQARRAAGRRSRSDRRCGRRAARTPRPCAREMPWPARAVGRTARSRGRPSRSTRSQRTPSAAAISRSRTSSGALPLRATMQSPARRPPRRAAPRDRLDRRDRRSRVLAFVTRSAEAAAGGRPWPRSRRRASRPRR